MVVPAIGVVVWYIVDRRRSEINDTEQP